MPDPRGLRVAVDARCLNTGHVRGMGKYLAEMLSHADQLAEVEWTLLGDRPECPFHVPALRRARTQAFDFKGYRYRAWEQIALPWRARVAGEVLHATATTLPWWQPIPTVVTLHDVLPWEARLQGRFERWYWTRLMPAALERCASVITISEASRRDILARWPWLAPKLQVVRHGIGDAYLQPVRTAPPDSVGRLAGDRRYLLYVGGAAEHKRFAWALQVFERLSDRGVCLLALGFTAEEAASVRNALSASLAGRVGFLPFVPEGEMPLVYAHAIATLYPTRYEGFGFPAVESQAVGTPVLFSAVGSLAELIGPLSHVVPVQDLDAWVSRLESIVAGSASGAGADPRVQAWARGFSWQRSAQAHLDIYRRAISSITSRTSA